MNQPPGGNGYPPGYPYPGQPGYPPQQPQQGGYGQPQGPQGQPQGPQGPAGGMDRTIAMPNAPGFAPQQPQGPYGQPPPPAYGQPPQPQYGQPPPGYGPPQGAPPGYGQPQQGGPPPGYGQPQGAPPGYGQPQGQPGAPPAYGQPQQPGGGFGGQQQMQQFGQQMNQGFNQMGAAMGGLPGVGGLGLQGGSRPTRRNAVMTMVIPFAIMLGSNIVFGILAGVTEIGALALLGSLGSLVGAVLMLMSVIKMTNELKSVTQNTGFAWWPIFIPLYQLYWQWIMVPAEVTKAKQMMGVQQPTRNIVVYIFFFLYAYAADLNDMAG